MVGAEQGGGDGGRARRRRTHGDPARGKAGRLYCAGGLARAVEFGGEGGQNYYITLPHIKLSKLII